MNDNAAFTGSIPEHYDTGLGPHIFEQHAAEMAIRVAERGPGIVLELAAGTGIVTRQLRDSLAAHTEIIATDLNDAMLEVAKAKFEPDELISFDTVDACDLPYSDARFDLLVCQFGIMFFPDRPQSFREALRVLKPSGTYCLSTWCSIEDNPFAGIALDVTAQFFPDDPPTFYGAPFCLPDPDPICDELVAAGFARASSERIELTSHIPDADILARGMTYGNPFVEEVKARGIDPEDIRAALASALRDRFGNPGKMRLAANLITALK